MSVVCADYYIYCLLNSLLNRLEVLVFDSDLIFSDVSLFRLSRLDFSFFEIKINMVSTLVNQILRLRNMRSITVFKYKTKLILILFY
jgi:hypothetical protein